MQEFNQLEVFVVDDGNVLDHSEFINYPSYHNIMRQIEAFKFPESKMPPGMLRNIIKGKEKNN